MERRMRAIRGGIFNDDETPVLPWQTIMMIGGVEVTKRIIVALAVSPLLMFYATQLLSAQGVEANPQYDQPKQVIALVEKAAALVEREGEKAFSKFRTKGREWFHGEVYVFVSDLEGMSLCSPPMPELEGKNINVGAFPERLILPRFGPLVVNPAFGLVS